jgi:hypothetical protein
VIHLLFLLSVFDLFVVVLIINGETGRQLSFSLPHTLSLLEGPEDNYKEISHLTIDPAHISKVTNLDR